MESRDKDRLDEWLEIALPQYGRAEPRVGLENRVLANLAVQRASASAVRRWWWILGTAAASAAVAIVLWLGSGPKDPSKSAANFTTNAASTGQPKAAATARSTVRQKHLGAPVRRTSQRTNTVELARSPKLSQFPSPQPLSDQERLLARYVRDFPQEAAIVAQAQTRAEAERQLEELAADRTLQINSDQQER